MSPSFSKNEVTVNACARPDRSGSNVSKILSVCDVADEDGCPLKSPVAIGTTGFGVSDGPGVGPRLDMAARDLLPACAYSAAGRDGGRD